VGQDAILQRVANPRFAPIGRTATVREPVLFRIRPAYAIILLASQEGPFAKTVTKLRSTRYSFP
jgi:hypothetical protein